MTRYTLYGSSQLKWINGALGGATQVAHVSLEVEDPDMELGLLRMTGPRLQAAMFGSLLLAAWLDFLNLADAVLRQCPSWGVERLYADMKRVQKMMEPSLRELASLEPGQVEATAIVMPDLMASLPASSIPSVRPRAWPPSAAVSSWQRLSSSRCSPWYRY